MPESAHPLHDRFVANLNEIKESIAKLDLGLVLTPLELSRVRGRLMFAGAYSPPSDLVPLLRALVQTCELSAIEDGLIDASELESDRRQPVPQAN